MVQTIVGLSRGQVHAASDQFDFVQTFDPRASVLATGTLTANKANLSLVRVGKPVTVNGITFYVAAASGNADVGVYSWDGTTATRLASSGSTAVAGTAANQRIALGAAVTLLPGANYYLALALDNATATIGRFGTLAPPAGAGNKLISKTVSFPLPTTLTGLVADLVSPWLHADFV